MVIDNPRLCRNVLDETTGRAIQSDNVPNIPIFRHNGTAVYSPSARNALSAFRTPLVIIFDGEWAVKSVDIAKISLRQVSRTG